MKCELDESSQKATDALFAALAEKLRAEPDYPFIHLKGGAEVVRANYVEGTILDVAQLTDRIGEYYLRNGVELSLEVAKDQVLNRARAGNSLVCNGLHHVHPLSAYWATRLRRLLNVDGRPAARIFYSTAASGAFDLHLDPFFTLTFQIEGAKLWKIARAQEVIDWSQLDHSILAPRPGELAEFPCGKIVGPMSGEAIFEDVLVEAGDALLIHPGVWHHVIPVSLSYSVAIDVMPLMKVDNPLEIYIVQHA